MRFRIAPISPISRLYGRYEVTTGKKVIKVVGLFRNGDGPTARYAVMDAVLIKEATVLCQQHHRQHCGWNTQRWHMCGHDMQTMKPAGDAHGRYGWRLRGRIAHGRTLAMAQLAEETAWKAHRP